MALRFGKGVEIDLDRMELRVDEVPVAVEPQVFDVLAYLVGHRDRLVTKEELLDNIWGDRFVSESALTSRIKSARQAVGDDGRAQAVIRTVHGRGYRFVAAVADHAAAPVGVGAGGRAAAEGGGATVGGPTRHRRATPPADPERWPLVGRHDELAQLSRRLHDPACGGILLSGPAGIGKTRLAHECLELAERAGWATAAVHGHAEAGPIPLAGLAHLLPEDVLDVAGHDSEIARAVVFRRACEALVALGAGRRVVLLVDNADLLDDLTTAIVGSVVSSGDAFAVLTQRLEPGDTIVLEDLVRADRVAHVRLGPLDDTDLDVLLYRVLAGPIEMASIGRLTDAAGGRPGALQQLVESCLARRTLERQADVWRLVGPLQPTVDLPGEGDRLVADLPGDLRRAAELLALAEELDLDVATSLLGDEALDELDRLGLLAARTDGDRLRVSLAQAHVAVLLGASLGQLRARRSKLELLAALAGRVRTLEDRLRAARWSIETGTPLDPGDALAAARYAVAHDDGESADLLLDHVTGGVPPVEVAYLRAELCYRRGQMGRAERLLDSLDLESLEPTDAAAAIRRRSTILFHVRGRFQDGLDLLVEQEPLLGTGAGRLLRAHWVGLQSFYGRAREVIEHGEPLVDALDGKPALEVLRSVAQAHLLVGGIDRALELLAEHERRVAVLPSNVGRPGHETAIAAMVTCHIEHGSVHRATELVHEHLPLGRRTTLAWLPLAAARAELAAGRPRAARALLTTPLAAVRSQNLSHAAPLMTGILAQSSAHLGHLDRARREAGDLLDRLDELDGQLRFALVLSLAEVWGALGEPDRVLGAVRAAARRAQELGTATSEARLLAAEAGLADPALVAGRLEELATRIDGPYWTVRARHVRALADGVDRRHELEQEYRRMGHDRLADLARDGR